VFASRTLADYIALAIAFVLAITIHEFAHAWMATRLGDSLPRRQGRLTLDPRAHLDPLGTLLIFVGGFGWGKPVQVNPWAIGGERNHALVALAGPVSNLMLATLAAIPFWVLPTDLMGGAVRNVLPSVGEVLFTIVSINILLAVFNMLPIVPLDGAAVFIGLLPPPLADPLRRIQQYGPLILMVLIFLPFLTRGALNPLGWIIGPPISFLLRLLLPL
jgi:Zn-dependent protease